MTRNLTILWLSMLLFVLTLASAAAAERKWQTFPAKVVSVYDGDTCTVEARSSAGKKETYRVRLAFIDAPETDQPGGKEAAFWLRGYVEGRKVQVKWRERDRYGRYVGEILVDGESVNAEAVSAGHAWVYEQYTPKELREALKAREKAAREQKVGMWGDDQPDVPPWEWRKTH